MSTTIKGKFETIEIDNDNIVISKSGVFWRSTQIPLDNVQYVDIKINYLANSRNILKVRYTNGIKEIEFNKDEDAKIAKSAIEDAIKKNKSNNVSKNRQGLFASFFSSKKSSLNENETVKAEGNERDYSLKSSSGGQNLTTYINGKVFSTPKSKSKVKAIFIAEYANSPKTVEQPWSQKWVDQYGIKNVDVYLEDIVNNGYLEEAVIGKALSIFTVDELKNILASLSINSTGSKSTIIQRLIESSDESTLRRYLPRNIYALTEKGIDYLQSNRSVLAEQFIDCDKAISRGLNISPEFKPVAKKLTKTKSSKSKMTDSEKLRIYKGSLKTLYEALKGREIKDQISVIKASKPSRAELEQDLRDICANACYSPVPYTKTMGAIRKYKDFYSPELIDQIYKSQTKYMLFDKDSFCDLVNNIANNDSFDFYKCIDEKWGKFVTDYMNTH